MDRLRISVGNQSIETVIPAAAAMEIPLPHRDDKSRYRDRKWASLDAGTLKLPKGLHKLTLEPLSMPGTQVMDFKQIKLTLSSPR